MKDTLAHCFKNQLVDNEMFLKLGLYLKWSILLILIFILFKYLKI